MTASIDDPIQRFRVYLNMGRLTEAAADADRIEAPVPRANALLALASHLPAEKAPDFAHRSVAVFRTLESSDLDSQLPAFTRSLASFGYLREAVDLTALAAGEVKRARLLTGLLSVLPADILPEIVEPFRTLVEAYHALKANPSSEAWAPGVSALLDKMEPDVHGEQDEARDAVADLLLRLFAQLAAASRVPFALELAGRIDDCRVRARVLRLLAEHLRDLPPAEKTRLWPLLIHKAATRQRRDLLSDLTNFSPLIYQLGNAAGFSQAIEDVTTACRWWA